MNHAIKVDKLSKWYGNVLGLSDVTLKIEPGITGLLGPNGAGKSTFLKLITGQIKSNIGSIEIFGKPIWNNYALLSGIGFCPEQDAFYDELTGHEFISALLKFYGMKADEIKSRISTVLDIVDLMKDKDRVIRSYSRGMRQRLKIAQAIAHDPEIVILDEPLNGLDPLGRRKIIKLIKSYETEGRTVIVSSHVLPEIEAMTQKIVLIHQGKIFAQGDIHYIRDLIDSHPHMIAIKCDNPRKLASLFVENEYVLNIHFGTAKDSILIETNNRDQFFEILPQIFVNEKIEVSSITSPDDNLQAVFDYLIGS